jgi:hypothetical protein
MNRLLTAACVAATLALGGCAAMNSVVSDVTSYSQWPAERQPTTYTFERLPSQQANPREQEILETAAREALAKIGFKEAADPQSSEVLVQLSGRVTRYDPPLWNDPFFWPGPWGPWGPWGWRSGWGMHHDFPRYDREVAVLIRDRKTGQTLYETRASNGSLASADARTWAAMFEAALKDFPQPAVNPRRISIPLDSEKAAG